MKTQVAIIRTGWVGTSVAISPLHDGIVDELVLCDSRAEIAAGEAMDLAHGASFYPRSTVDGGPASLPRAQRTACDDRRPGPGRRLRDIRHSLSLPRIVGDDGAGTVLEPAMTSEEVGRLSASAAALGAAYERSRVAGA